MTDEQWDAMLDIHASAQFRVLRAYGRWLRGNADQNSPVRKVINISSTMGIHGGATQLAYSAGKAAVVGITKTAGKSPYEYIYGGGRRAKSLQCHSQRSRFWRYRHALNKSLRERTQYIYGEGPSAQSRFES